MTEYIIGIEGTLHEDYIELAPKISGEIVRCRDCEYYKPYRTYQHGIMNRCHDEQGHTHRRYESDFCSRGERRSE